MNQPQRWRGSHGSISGALIFIGMLLALLLTTSGCVHVAMMGMMTNVSQAHQINEMKKRLTATEAGSGQSNRGVPR